MVFDTGAIVDLHIHSTASDGTLTPAEILSLALKKGLGAISITDHDAVEGSRQLLKAGAAEQIGFLTGVEISASPPKTCASQGSIHILGYGFDIDHPVLNETLRKLRDARQNRNPKIVAKLNELGIAASLEDIAKLAGDCQLARPHIAKFLVHSNVVGSMDEAFDKYLAKGRPAYVEKFRISCQEAIRLIVEAGGLPVLAHPYLVETAAGADIEDLVAELIASGLRGIEVYYPEHPPELVETYARLAEKYGLAVTGGTDFHGDIKPQIQIGTGYGDFSVSMQVYRDLARALGKEDPVDSYDGASRLSLATGYEFRDPELLDEALRHSSWVNEQGVDGLRDNERFEFLGDAVLNLSIAKRLMEMYPDLREGELSRIRASLVNDARLAELARDIRLGDCVRLGKGELLTDGRNKASILADAFEALIAAIFLDGGFESAEKFVRVSFEELLKEAESFTVGTDFKSRLQEIVQTRHNATPEYRIVEEDGPDHDKTFHARIDIFGASAVGVGKSKKAAEQEAARILLERIEEL